MTPLLCSPSGNFTFERWRPQPPAYTVTIRNDAFFLMLIACGDFHSVAVARTGRGAKRVATWGFGVGIVGFRADSLLGFGLPEAANPIAALSRYLDSRFVDSADVFFATFLVVGILARNEPHLSEGLHHGQVAADAAVGSRADVMTTLSQEHRIFGVPECP